MTRACHARNVVHGEVILSLDLVYHLLYGLPLLSLTINLSHSGTLALVRKLVNIPEYAGLEHLAPLSRSALTTHPCMEQLDTVEHSRILQKI